MDKMTGSWTDSEFMNKAGFGENEIILYFIISGFVAFGTCL